MFILESLKEAELVLQKFIQSPDNIQKINSAIQMMAECFKNQGKIFSAGNGGSMCDSMHFAEELTGRFRKERSPLPAMAISDPSHLTCVANDYGYDYVFSKYLEAWGSQNDIFLAISTSGNSKNVILATEIARKKGMKIIGLLGKKGGALKNLVDIAIVVDSEISDRIQEVHIKCIHIFIEGIERKLFPENYN